MVRQGLEGIALEHGDDIRQTRLLTFLGDAARESARREQPTLGGELPAGLDVPAAVDLLGRPVYHRILMTGDPVDEDFISMLIDHFLRGFARG